MLELNKLYNMDCMEGMKTFPDKYFDLAIVDPPYGMEIGTKGKNSSEWGISRSTKANTGLGKNKEYNKKEWDLASPSVEYFNELFRVANKSIIWGGNNFTDKLPAMQYYITWYKTEFSNNKKYSDTELAYVSWKIVPRIYKVWWNGLASTPSHNKGESRFHPTQKPKDLYKKILRDYAKPNFKILDTHAGSCSSVIAFLDFGCDWIAFEIDKDYYEAANKRIEIHKQQGRLSF